MIFLALMACAVAQDSTEPDSVEEIVGKLDTLIEMLEPPCDTGASCLPEQPEEQPEPPEEPEEPEFPEDPPEQASEEPQG